MSAAKTEEPTSQFLTLTPSDNHRLYALCGQGDDNLRQIEKRLKIAIHNRGHVFQITGENATQVATAIEILKLLYSETESGTLLSADEVQLAMTDLLTTTQAVTPSQEEALPEKLFLRKHHLRLRTQTQKQYVYNIRQHDITFGIGPAGTGKTYLAVALACEALEQEKVERIILARPAVEAGEKLGFLPGDLAQKVDPYLRALYDSLYELMGAEQVQKLVERNVIEIAPLAYMRGRTLSHSFIILDESQNTTIEQMKMFLTRFGFGSKVVITGDITQVDLPRDKESGLKHAMQVLSKINEINFTYFKASDTVRHPLIQSIVEAYEGANASLQQQPINPRGRTHHSS